MKDILKQAIVCTGIGCLTAVSAVGCGETLEPPDTLEDILGVPGAAQETTTAPPSSTVNVDFQEDTTEYQSIFFQVETETEMTTETEAAPPAASVTEHTDIPIPEQETDGMTTTGTTGYPEFASGTEQTAPAYPVTTETVTTTDATRPATTESPEMPEDTACWEQLYRTFLEQAAYERQFPENSNKQDVKFMLLYLNDDTIPELFIQTTGSVYFYTYRDGWVYFIDSVTVSRLSYNFYYRPYQYCICTTQGSMLVDGNYLDVREYEASDTERSGIGLKAEYYYPTRDYGNESDTETDRNTDLERTQALDIHLERSEMLGSSWFTIPDVLEADTNINRYMITEENLNAVFGEPELPEEQDTAETQKAGESYAFR